MESTYGSTANYQAAHNKVIVVDADTRERDDDHRQLQLHRRRTAAATPKTCVILRDNRDVARAYRDNWLRLKAACGAVAGCEDRLALNFRPC